MPLRRRPPCRSGSKTCGRCSLGILARRRRLRPRSRRSAPRPRSRRARAHCRRGWPRSARSRRGSLVTRRPSPSSPHPVVPAARPHRRAHEAPRRRPPRRARSRRPASKREISIRSSTSLRRRRDVCDQQLGRPTRLGRHAIEVVGQQRGLAQQRGQRRAQLVRDVRGEAPLRAPAPPRARRSSPRARRAISLNDSAQTPSSSLPSTGRRVSNRPSARDWAARSREPPAGGCCARARRPPARPAARGSRPRRTAALRSTESRAAGRPRGRRSRASLPFAAGAPVTRKRSPATVVRS